MLTICIVNCEHVFVFWPVFFLKKHLSLEMQEKSQKILVSLLSNCLGQLSCEGSGAVWNRLQIASNNKWVNP